MADDTPSKPPGLLIGYARVSTEDQDLALQLDALVKAGVSPTRIFKEHASGASEGLSVRVAAERVGMSASAAYGELRRLEEEETADDLED